MISRRLSNYLYFVNTSVPPFFKNFLTNCKSLTLRVFRSNTADLVPHSHMTDINKLHRYQRPSWSYRSNYTIRGLITDGITKGATRLNILQTGSDRAHQQTAKAEQISRFGCVTNFRRYLVILRTPLVFLQPFVTRCIEVYCNVNQRALTLKTIQGELLLI